MEVKSVVLDILLPSVAVIATGLFTYALTGGPEEFEDLHSDRGNTSPLQSSEHGISSTDGYSNDPTNNTPEWATKLLEKVNVIASDVKQLQEKQEKQHPNVICKSCQKLVSTASNSNDSTSTSSPSSLQTKSDPLLSNPVVTEPISLETLLSNLRNAVTQMGAASAKVSSSIPTLETIEDPSKPQPQLSTATAIAPTPLQKGCDMLLMYLKNIKMQPGVPRYRKISTTNASYRDSLESLAGHHAVLEAVGFAKAGSYFEWTWTAAAIDSTANSNLNLLQSKKHNSLPVPDEAMVETILGEGIRLLEELRNS